MRIFQATPYLPSRAFDINLPTSVLCLESLHYSQMSKHGAYFPDQYFPLLLKISLKGQGGGHCKLIVILLYFFPKACWTVMSSQEVAPSL